MTIDDTLNEREKTHGEYVTCAKIHNDLTDYIQNTPHWDKLNACQKTSLRMIMLKVARILNGNPNVVDDYLDISGYSQLIVRELEKNEIQSR